MAFVVVVFFCFCFCFFTFPSNNWLVPHSRQRVRDMASDRTQRFHIQTAKQVVDATLGEIATSFPGFSPTRPTDGRVGDCARRRWKTLGILSSISNCSRPMTKPLTSSSVADALAECYKNAGHWESRREILSIRDRPLEKLLGGGGDFWAAGIFFPYQIPILYEYF